jgi:hypothetical protein
MTHEEITSLIKFAKEIDRRAVALRLSQAELSRRTATDGAEAISQGYISDILRVGRGDSKKYFRPQRDKVIRLALAVEWDVNEALDIAGFKSAQERANQAKEREAQAARLAKLIHNWSSLPLEKQDELIAISEIMQPKHPQLFNAPIEIAGSPEDLTDDAEIEDTDNSPP